MSTLATQPARASGEFAIGGDLPVVRLGYGTMLPRTRTHDSAQEPAQ